MPFIMLKRCLFVLFPLAISFFIISFVKRQPSKSHLKTIILDAGHGGKDPGAPCWSKGCWEGDITLSIVLKLGNALEDKLPNVKVYYTRKDDSYPSLNYRADYANEKKGDLFVSVHCNSRDPLYKKEPNGTKTVTYYVGKGKKKKKMTKQVEVFKTVKYPNPVKGLETYVWIPSKSGQKTDAIAARENAEIFKDPDYKKKYGGGLDINSAEFIAKAKLRSKRFFFRSNQLATLIQEEGANIGRNDRSVKQRGDGIWVLQATAMPAVLVETGYVSNPEEEKYLNSNKGQLEMADIIAKAIKKYHDDLDKNDTHSEKETSQLINNPNYFLKSEEIFI
jgi:N-acetylmuramoyl-L-alanine amidase